MTLNNISERQNKLNLLRKYKLSDKWQEIEKEYTEKREEKGNIVLDMYAFRDEQGEIRREKKAFTDKNKATWMCENATEFMNRLGEGEAESIIKEELKEKIHNAEEYVKYSYGTSTNTFRSPTDAEYTESDYHCIWANLYQDNIRILEILIDRYTLEVNNEKETPKTTEDNTDL